MQFGYKLVELTQELYTTLIKEDYRYFLIWDIAEERGCRNFIFIANKEMPQVPGYGCTSILNPMVRNIVMGKLSGVSAKVKVPVGEALNVC